LGGTLGWGRGWGKEKKGTGVLNCQGRKGGTSGQGVCNGSGGDEPYRNMSREKSPREVGNEGSRENMTHAKETGGVQEKKTNGGRVWGSTGKTLTVGSIPNLAIANPQGWKGRARKPVVTTRIWKEKKRAE